MVFDSFQGLGGGGVFASSSTGLYLVRLVCSICQCTRQLRLRCTGRE